MTVVGPHDMQVPHDPALRHALVRLLGADSAEALLWRAVTDSAQWDGVVFYAGVRLLRLLAYEAMRILQRGNGGLG